MSCEILPHGDADRMVPMRFPVFSRARKKESTGKGVQVAESATCIHSIATFFYRQLSTGEDW